MTWLAGWSYRKSDTITGSSVGIQTDYPVGVKVYYGSGVNGTEVIGGVTFGKVYMDSLCKTDFGDIRFAKLDATLLDYWIEEQVDSDYAIIWVEVDSIPANPGTVDIYIYYGNAGATTTGNGDDTFTFFDDFTQDRGWTIGNPTYIEIIDPEDVLWIDYRRNAANLYCYRSVSGLTDGFALWIDSWYDITTGSDDWSYGIFSLSVDNDGSRHSESEIYGIRGWGQAYGNKHGLIYWNGVGASGSQDGDADPNSDRFTYRISKHDTRLEYYCSSGNVPDGTAVVSAGIPAIAYMKGWTSSSQAGDVNDDCRKKIHVIRIRKWVYPEPAHTAWGDFGAVDLAAGFTVRQDSAGLPAGFRVTQEVLPAQFNVRQVASQDLAAQFIPIRIASPLELPASFITGGRGNVPARFRVTKYYDLEGTGGIAFYWWGAANPVEAMNQLILESPTGFWYTDFYDGPAAWRLVEIPWGSFTWVSAPQRRLEPHRYWPYPPDQTTIGAFIWTVHTHGLRRLDYVYAYPRVLPAQLIGYFDIRRTATVELAAGFMVRQVASPELKASFTVRHPATPLNLGAAFDIRNVASQNLAAQFEVRQDSVDLHAKFIVPLVHVDLFSICMTNDKIYVHQGISATIRESFASPESTPQAITFDGTNLITADWSFDLIYVHVGISSSIDRTFATPYDKITGLTFDGTNLISCDQNNVITHHDGISAAVLAQFAGPRPGGSPDGVAFDGVNLISCDASTIYVHQGISDTITRSFLHPSFGASLTGIAYDGTNLISVAANQKLIFVHDGISDIILYSFTTPGSGDPRWTKDLAVRAYFSNSSGNLKAGLIVGQSSSNNLKAGFTVQP